MPASSEFSMPTRRFGSFLIGRPSSISDKSDGLIFEAQPAARAFSANLGKVSIIDCYSIIVKLLKAYLFLKKYKKYL